MMVMTAPVEFGIDAREALHEVITESYSMFSDEDDEEPREEVEGVDYRMVRGKRFPIRMNSEAQVATIAGPMVAKR